jgi:hypothetical protein
LNDRIRRGLIASTTVLAFALPATAAAAGPNPAFTLGPDGQASSPTEQGNPAASITDICMGDFNADGKSDAAVTMRIAGAGEQRLSVAYGDGTGSLSTWNTVATTTGTGNCAAADFDGDGRDDVAFSGGGTADIALERSTGSGFTETTVTAADNGTAIEAGDVDGDGETDLVVASDLGTAGPGRLQALINDGAGAFTPAAATSSGGYRPIRLEVGDVNDDGRADALAGNFGDSGSGNPAGIAVALGQADGTFVQQGDQGGNPDAFALADSNSDGLPDLVVGSANRLQVLLNQGSGNFSLDPAFYPPLGGDDPLTAAGAIEAADLNGDGITDLLVGDRRSSQTNVQLFAFTGTGSSTAPFYDGPFGPYLLAEPVGADVRAIGIADLDGDGFPDFTAGTSISVGLVGSMLNVTQIPPASLAPAGISGAAVAGRTLTCTPGTWRGRSISYSYEWLRNGAPISGETAPTYVVRDGDAGSQISCRVTAANTAGSAQSTSASLIAVAAPQPPANVERPAVSGRADYGSTVACAAGSWTAGGSFTYAWLRDGKPISGASSAGYRVEKDDIGHALACRVSVENADGTDSADSATVDATGCLVPALKGAKLGKAKRSLKAAGCKPGKVSRKRGGKPGRVVRTKPKGGSAAPTGARIDLVVGKG